MYIDITFLIGALAMNTSFGYIYIYIISWGLRMSTTVVLLFSLFTEKKDSILPESEKGATNLTKDPLNKFDAPTPHDQLIKVP